ncbi:flagellar export chaperone FliS [Cohnella sp. CIP 111063]|uniref:flagellar export chaperone FliS n=1 Tax=unclassified Cohnella TaxID=2636738 RepID=UPI000B8C58BB|nr:MULTISPECIES: flagellar export chaperone FliS [unclassified Cohnella]OXS55890.1 flagellar export chaperone FliS [Cohnella sp. CIP 111063]PRX67092.1 flagellar protein FliS [Cohnella sp. SGD-V74]
MISTPFHKYQQSSVQTASPAQLILMLYDGAIRFIKQGIDGIEAKDYQKANHSLIRSQHIVNELIASLNHEYPIANNLLDIYDYANRKLIEANMKKNKQSASEVISILSELREAWVQIIKSTNPKESD